MNISGLVVLSHSEHTATLREELAALVGVELHAVQDDGRMVITIEDHPEASPADTLMRVQNLKGVVAASLVYNYCDDEH
jgi:nitrate reductase NapD